MKCLLIELESIEYWNLRQHFQTQAHLWSLLKSGPYFLFTYFSLRFFKKPSGIAKSNVSNHFHLGILKPLNLEKKTYGGLAITLMFEALYIRFDILNSILCKF